MSYTSQELDTLVEKICKSLGWTWNGRKPPKKLPNTLPHDPQNDSPTARLK